MRIITKKDLDSYKDLRLTVGELKKQINNLPDDTIVLIERIEDKYYEDYEWGVYLKEGEQYHNAEYYNTNMLLS